MYSAERAASNFSSWPFANLGASASEEPTAADEARKLRRESVMAKPACGVGFQPAVVYQF
jgi:hypothetical protein